MFRSKASSWIVPCLLALAAAFSPACASSSHAADGKPGLTGRAVRIAYFNYASGQKLTLVNESHTDRTQLYSNKRPLEDAGTKVTTDEVLDETTKFFETKGFFEEAQTGPAPKTAEGVYTQSLEFEAPGRAVHLSIRKDTPAAERQRFLECAQAFVVIYNNTYQLQSVDRPPDWSSQASRPASKKSP